MTDNVTAPGPGTQFATDKNTADGNHYPLSKIVWGPLGTYTILDDANGKRLPVKLGPDPAALADATVNPTTASFGSLLHGWNSATWDRLRTGLPGTNPSYTNGVLVAGMTFYDNVGQAYRPVTSRSGDGIGDQFIPQLGQESWNGGTWDRLRNNQDTTALVTRSNVSVGGLSADQTNYNGRGVQVVVDITAITAGSVVVKIRGKDAASGKYYDLLVSAAIAATGTYLLTVYPGAAVTANVSANTPLPRTWRIEDAITTGPATYTVGASVIL